MPTDWFHRAVASSLSRTLNPAARLIAGLMGRERVEARARAQAGADLANLTEREMALREEVARLRRDLARDELERHDEDD